MQSRRDFFTASTVAVAVGGALVAGGLPAGAAGVYDFAAIEERLNLPARHRQAFSSHRLADGAAADFILNSLNAYQFDYGEGPGTLHALAIFYGSALPIVVDDGAWRKYQLAEVQRRRSDPATSHSADAGNPYLAAKSPLDPAASRTDLHGFYHDASLTALLKRGATFLACDNALRGLATDIAVTYGISTDPVSAVHADLRAHLVPGTLLVPAGVAAINQAQEAKFTLMPTSV